MTERGRLGRQHLFCFVDVAVLQAVDHGEIQLGEETQKAADIGVIGIPPELPVFVRRQFLGVEPYRAARGFPHLGA